MSALTATKKRRKSELNANPQIMGCRNKCLNEKRRREQENIYIEELAELISASIADMSALSVKPDKCAILQETVNQIRRIKASEEAVQQGEVSSSTTILANEILCPLVLEALDGFLFVVNTEGKVEFVSENVQSFINFQQSDILHQTIYNIIHVGDHARFSGNLLPMSIGWAGGDSKTQRSFNMRIRVKSEAEHFENMQISAIQMPRDSEENCLVCIARRLPPNERPVGAPVEQFTTKLLRNGTVIGLDVSGLSDIYKQHLPKNLVGTLLQELCHQQDLQKLVSHLQDALSQGSSTSSLYKIRMGPEKFVQIQTKSKFFAFKSSTEPGFIMATHTIVNTETDDSEKPQQSVQQQLVPNTDSKSPNSDTNNNSEDTQSDVLSAPRQSQQQVPNASQCNSSQSSFATFQLQSEIDLNLDALWPSDLDSSPSGLGTSQTQPVHPSPIGGSPAQPSLAATWGVQGSPSSMYVSPQYGFAYSPQVVKEEDSDAQVQSNTSGGDRLRNLLTNSPQQATSANMQPPKQENKILKGLLNAEDESAEGTGPNNMLLQLLNKDTAEPKKGAELLQQLLNSNQDDNRSPRGMKRPYVEEPPLPGTSRNPPGDLCKKNPRLVNLLKIRPDNQPIPQIPPDILQSVPNEKLRVVKDNQANWPRPRAPVAHSSPSLQSLLNQQTPSQDMRRPQMLQAAVRPTQQQQQQFILPSTSATSAGDDILSEIIDQVLEFVPETSQFRDNDPVLPIFEEASVPSNSNELAMIDAIQKELMECEHAVQFSTSPATQQSQQLQINQQAQQVMMSRGLFPQMQAPNGQPMDQFSQPLYIQRTTTTTTTLAGRLAGRGPPNVIAPGSPQQQLTPQQQQLLQQQLQQRRKQQLIQQQALQSQQIPQQLLQQSQQAIGQQLQHQQGNRPITLDSLLNTNAPPPNVTLPRDGMSPINQMGMRPNQANQFSQMRAQFQGQQPGVMQQQQQQQRWAATQQANPQLLQQAARMGVQQRNPMLNAQLSGGHAGTGHVVGTAQPQYSPLQSPGQNQVQPQMQQGNLQQQPQLQQMQFDEFGNFPQQVRQQRPPQQVIPNNSEVLRKSLGDLVRARSAAAAATGGGIMGQSGNTINTGDRGGLVISGGGIVPSNNVVGGNGAGVPDLEALGISFDVKEQGGGSLYY